jgi:hypothetical protein
MRICYERTINTSHVSTLKLEFIDPVLASKHLSTYDISASQVAHADDNTVALTGAVLYERAEQLNAAVITSLSQFKLFVQRT